MKTIFKVIEYHQETLYSTKNLDTAINKANRLNKIDNNHYTKIEIYGNKNGKHTISSDFYLITLDFFWENN